MDILNSSDFLSGECVKNLVTVVIPTWNGKRFLTGVLDSLATQTYAQVEVIVVDNGSHDGSVEFMREKYWICCGRQPGHKGINGRIYCPDQ